MAHKWLKWLMETDMNLTGKILESEHERDEWKIRPVVQQRGIKGAKGARLTRNEMYHKWDILSPGIRQLVACQQAREEAECPISIFRWGSVSVPMAPCPDERRFQMVKLLSGQISGHCVRISEENNALSNKRLMI